ncbi:MAG: lysophospholipase [Caulobacteraceae bacterium]|nr:lysophospholipase [Caulobacteraceae bacterium]
MHRTKIVALIAAAAALGISGLALAQGRAAPNDYSNKANWLCWPGKVDGSACASSQDYTVVNKDGSTKVVRFVRPKAPAYDCFYVYPTASEDPTPNSDMIPGRELSPVTTSQFGRYGAVCRQFAPMYRSVTLAALRSGMAGNPMPGIDRELNYNDVKDAWNYYLAHENKGRGVVLVGHSQGAGLLTRLVQQEIEGKPVQGRIISVVQPGTTIQVPPGKDVGGTYKSMPLCRKPGQFGCIAVWSTFRADRPPSVTPASRFAREAKAQGTVASCVNPAALAGGKAEMDVYQSKGTIEWAKGKTIDTPYVRLPGMVSASCVTKGEYTYLETTVNGTPTDARNNTLVGDVGTPPDPTWGLHNGDMSVAIGDAVRMVDAQAKAWIKANGKR